MFMTGQIGHPHTAGTAPYVHQSKSVAMFSGIHLCDLYFLVIAARSSKSSAKVSASGSKMVSRRECWVSAYILMSILVFLGHGEQEIGTFCNNRHQYL